MNYNKFFLTLTLVSCISCTVISIKKDTTNPTFLNSGKSEEKIDVTVIGVERGENLSKTKFGVQIIDDFEYISSFLKAKGIEKIKVIISVTKDMRGSCPSCLFIWPEFRDAFIQVE